VYTTEYQAETEASPEQVWAALRALHSGHRFSDRSDLFELHGPFAVGTMLSVTPVGQDTLTSVIVELVENDCYADRTEFNGLTLTFRHTLARTERGTLVTHQLTIDGEQANVVGPELGPQISGDFPEAMEDLFTAATGHVGAAR
jgi:hypothetical protein